MNFDPTTATPIDSVAGNSVIAPRPIYDPNTGTWREGRTSAPVFDPSTAVPAEPSPSFDPSTAQPIDFGDVDAGSDSTAGSTYGIGRLLSRAGRTAASRALDLGALIQSATPSGIAENVTAQIMGNTAQAQGSLSSLVTGTPPQQRAPTTTEQIRDVARDIAPAPAAKDDYAGRTADFVGGVVPDLTAAVLSGGTSLGESVLARVGSGALSMALPAAENARQRYESGVAAGQDRVDALGGAAVTAAGTLATGAVPASVGASLLTRVGTGAVIGAGTSEIQRRAENAVSPDSLQRDFDPFDAVAGAVFGGTVGGMHGVAPRADGHHDVLAGGPSRSDFSLDRADPRAVRSTFDPTTARPVAAGATAPAVDAIGAARSALDAQLGDVSDFDAAWPIAQRVADQHGVAVDDLLPTPDWMREPAQDDAGAAPQAVANDAAPQGFDASTATPVQPESPAESNTPNIPQARAQEVQDALAGLERAGLDAETLATVRAKLMDEPRAESTANTNTEVDSARAGTEAAAQDSTAQRTPDADASVPGRTDETLDVLIDRAQAAGATLGEITAASRSPDEAAAAQALRELIARKDEPAPTDAPLDPKGAKFSRASTPVRTDDGVLEGWTRLAQHDEAFRHTVSDKTDLPGTIRDAIPGATIAHSSDLAEGNVEPADRAWRVTMPGAGEARIFQKGREVWIDVADLEQGQAGQRVYNAAANYAHNAGKVFVGDPAGLSTIALKRRTENMLSSALKYGTTKHLRPHDRQLIGNRTIGVPPLRWKEGDDAHNMRELMRTSYATTLHEFPEIEGMTYNPETERFEREDGTEVTDAQFRDIAASRRAPGPPRPDDGPDVQALRNASTAGSSTLKRAVLTGTLVRREGSEGGRELLARLSAGDAEHPAGEPVPQQLKRILYRRPEAAAEQRGEALPERQHLSVDAVDAIANELIAQYKGNLPLRAHVRESIEELYGRGSEEKVGPITGAYHSDRGLLALAANRLSDRAAVETTFRHEVLGHYGMDTLAPRDRSAILKAISDARNEPSLKAAWEKVDRNYADKDEATKAEEVFASLAEQDRGAGGRMWDRILTMLNVALRTVGLVKSVITRAELHDLARTIGDRIRRGDATRQSGDLTAGEGSARFSRSELPRTDLDGAQQAALDKIGVSKESLPRKVERLASRWRESAAQGLVDQFAPIKDLDPVAYMQARLSRGVDGAVEATFLHGTPKLTDGALDIDHDGKGLRGVLTDLAGEHDLFLAWIAGNRAERLAKEGRERLFSAGDIRALKGLNLGKMVDGRSRVAVYARALTEFNRYQRAVLDVAEQSGLINSESRANWANEFYIPFKRIDTGENGSLDPTDLAPPRVSKGTPEPVEELKGGTDRLGDLLSNTLDTWNKLLVSSMRNQAATKALAAAEKLGEARKLEEPTKDSLRVRIDGKPVHYEVDDPLLVDALTMLNFNGWQSPALRIMSKFKRVLSFGVTLSPSFRVRNLLRDTVSALAISDHTGRNPLRNIVDGWSATKEGSATDIKLLAGGGKVRFGALTDGGRAVAAKRLIRSGVDGSQILDTPAKVKKALGEAWHWYQEMGDRGESVNRAVIYDRARAAGKSHLEASYEARDLLDFTMSGKWAAVRLLTQTVPFLNARIQGLYRLGRGAKANPQRFSAVTGAVALASVTLYLAQRDDEDYKALPDYARDSYWIVKLGDKMLYIPKPFEIGALGTVAERSVELAVAGDDYRARDFATSLYSIAVDQLAMNPIPQAVRPALESAFNYDTFRGKPIDSEGQERLPPAQRYTSRTSAAAIAIGRATNTSPNQIEHLVGGYLGWLGTQALSVADVMARRLTDLPPNPNRDATKIRNWPLLGDFVKEAAGGSSKYVERLYSAQQQLEQQYAGVREAALAGDDAEAERMGQGLDKLGTYRGGAKALASIRAEIRQVENDKSLTTAERRARLDELNLQRNRVAREVDVEARARP